MSDQDSSECDTRDLDPRQQSALEALLTEPSHAAAAARADVSESTLRRWRQQPAFRAAYRHVRRECLEGAVARLQSLAAEAVETLRHGLSHPNPGHQIRAAQLILYNAFRGADLMDLVDRIGELEATVSRTTEGGSHE